MKVLSIDPSYSNCGVVVWEDGLLYDYFVIQTSKVSEEVVRLAHIIDTLKKVIKENFKNLPTPLAQGGERYVTYSSCFSSSSLKAWRFLSRPFPACA